jgi:hypothetical protein
VKDGELAKLLGVPFELNLDTKEVDAFLIEKLRRNLGIGTFFTCLLLVGL